MKKCPICGRDVLSKRKDAVFCRDAACRKKAQQARKEQAPPIAAQASGPKASVVVTFPDGKRWLLELSPLDGAHSTLPSLATLPASSPPAAVPVPPPEAVPASPPASVSTPPPASVSTPPPAAVLASPPAPVSVPPPPAVPASPPAVVTPDPAVSQRFPSEVTRQKALRTVELFFIDGADALVRFKEAVQARPNRPPAIRHFAKAQLCAREDDGYGLGGSPGLWPQAFPQRSPAEFGLDADVGVLFYDEDDDRAYVPSPELLAAALGSDWRTRLRAHADGDTR